MTAACLVRLIPGEGEGFDLDKFVERSLFLLKRDAMICDYFVGR